MCFRILRWNEYPALVNGPGVIIRLLIKGRGKRAKVGDPGKGSAASFEGRRKSHEPRNTCSSAAAAAAAAATAAKSLQSCPTL